MKKFYSFLVAAVLLMGATSCQKEATADAGAADNVEFVASIAGGRTELGDGNKVMWNNGDKIRIFTQENFAGTEFNSDATAATATAKFTTTKSFTASNNGYLAVYPETANTTGNGFSSTVHNASYAEGVWSIPVNMQGCNSFNYPFTFEKNSFMVAFSNDNQLSFKAATALLKIKNIENGWGGSVKLFGANLCGEATLHYDTNNAENPISYTLSSGDSQFEYNFPEQNGETIYVPIYPGTVTGFEVYGDDVENPLVTYNKTITFKAGVIYDLDLDNAPIGGGNNSPYSLFSGMASIPMTIENGFHVAKNVPFAEWGYWIMEGQSTFYEVSGNITMGTWMELIQGMNTGIIFEAESADFYMAEDASMLCIVPAGTLFENLPALPVKTVSPWVLSTGMQEVTMYVDDNGYHYAKNVPAGSWWIFPENRETMHGLPVETPVDGTWYKMAAYPEAYSIWLEEPMNVYLSPEADYVCLLWPGMTLPELPEPEPKYLYVENDSQYTNLYVYAHSGADMGTWPGTQLTETKEINGVTYLFIEQPEGTNAKFIFNNGDQSQVQDVSITLGEGDVYYRVTKNAATVIADAATYTGSDVDPHCLYIYDQDGVWASKDLYCHYWNVNNSSETTDWPGVLVNKSNKTKIDGKEYYYVEMPSSFYNKTIGCIFHDENDTNRYDFDNDKARLLDRDRYYGYYNNNGYKGGWVIE